jgi:hypothetical protein
MWTMTIALQYFLIFSSASGRPAFLFEFRLSRDFRGSISESSNTGINNFAGSRDPRMMINDGSSRQSSPPPSHDYDKFNFLPHVLNLLNLIHSDADTGAVSQEVHNTLNLADSGCAITASIP